MPRYDIGLDHELVPQQPGLLGRTENMVEAVDVWNPVCKKNKVYIYQFDTTNENNTVEVLPDNCLDFVFVCNDNPKAYLVGPVSQLTEEELEPNSTYYIFKPFSLLGTTLADLAASKDIYSQRIPLDMLFDDLSVVESINKAASFQERTDLFMKFAQKHLINPDRDDHFVENLELLICRRRGKDKINFIADQTGYTARYCRDKFKNSLGVSLKNYSDIIRMQNVVRILLKDLGGNVFDAAFENNFYDQSHLIHVLKKYTGYTPNEFIQRFNGRAKLARQPGILA